MRPLYGGAKLPAKKPFKQPSFALPNVFGQKPTKPSSMGLPLGISSEDASAALSAFEVSRIPVMGRHLFADIHHDFPGYKGPFYNIGGDLKYTPSLFSEDAIVTDIKTNAETYGIANPRARLDNQIVFTVPEKTATFQSWIAPKLHPVGNDRLGIVQDAGEKITNALGAQNVLTFGSILDPAGKPIRPSDRPIWFDPSLNDFSIDVSDFGFTQSILQGVRIKDLTAGTVKSSFLLSGGTEVDAVAMVEGEPTQPKPINQTKIELAGFYTSITQAEGASDVMFNIGKTLGDAMLVASCMPNLPTFPKGTVSANPFHPSSGNGTWRQWAPFEPPMTPPETLILKTGDRLNHIRAFAMSVGSILEQQVGGGRVVKQYEYIPGDVSKEAILNALDAGFDDLKVRCQEAYGQLIASLESLLTDGSVKEGFSGFTGNDILRTSEGRQRGGELLRNIISTLQTLPERVLVYIDSMKRPPGQETDVKIYTDIYNTTVNTVERITPPTRTVFAKPEKTLNLNTKIVVSRGKSDDPLPSLSIGLWNAFAKLDTPNSNILGTDIYRQFFDKLSAQPVVEAAAEPDKTQEYVNEVVGQVGGQRGGVRRDIQVHPIAFDIIRSGKEGGYYPTIQLFFDYLDVKGVADVDKVDYLTDVVVFFESDRIVDMTLAESLREELELVIDESPDELQTLLQWEPNPQTPSTPATVMFNAFTCFVNAENSIEPSLTKLPSKEDPADLYTYFKKQEQLFLEKLNQSITTLRSGRTLLTTLGRRVEDSETFQSAMALLALRQETPTDEAAESLVQLAQGPSAAGSGAQSSATGGLRTRRSIYSNARKTTSLHVDGTSNNEGLRERVGTRTTPRVRKSSRSTRRRR